MSSQDKQLVVRHVLATICAEHTRHVQLLFADFYKGNVSMQQYRKRSRELTQRLVDEVIAVKKLKRPHLLEVFTATDRILKAGRLAIKRAQQEE